MHQITISVFIVTSSFIFNILLFILLRPHNVIRGRTWHLMITMIPAEEHPVNFHRVNDKKQHSSLFTVGAAATRRTEKLCGECADSRNPSEKLLRPVLCCCCWSTPLSSLPRNLLNDHNQRVNRITCVRIDNGCGQSI